MLLNKSDVGVYSYGPSGPGAVRPHALLSLPSVNGKGSIGYSCDANGNLQTASAGKYRSIIGGSMAGTRTTWFLHPDNAGNLGFEYEINSPSTPSAANPNAVNARHYLSFGGQTLGVLVSSATLPTLAPGQTAPPPLATIALNKLEFWHKDHLGSLSATTDHRGAVTARCAYDPFGKRRSANGSYDPFGNIVADFSPAQNAGTDRGFTQHEHLDDVGIIHMNGRLFDPNLGRFLQADRFIQAPTDLQNYNRYAYCLNNPLTCTDPTGLIARADENIISIDSGDAFDSSSFDLNQNAEPKPEPEKSGDKPDDQSVVVTGERPKPSLVLSTLAISMTGSAVSEASSVVVVTGKRIVQPAVRWVVPIAIIACVANPAACAIALIAAAILTNDVANSEGPKNAPNPKDFEDPSKLPDGWGWRGRGQPGSRNGAYYNPGTGESMHDDRTHPDGKDPHWTYTDPEGQRWDNFGSGWIPQS